MSGLRWCARSAVTFFAVFALCLASQHAPVLSAKDKADSTATSKKNAKKKARADAKKKGKKGADNSAEAADGSGLSGGSGGGSGAGGLPPGSGSSSGGNATSGQGGSSSTNSNSNSQGGGTASSTSPAKSSAPATGGVGKGGGANQAAAPQQGPNPAIVQKVMDVQNRNHAALAKQKGITGTATGLDDDGNVVIKVYTTGADNPKIPTQIENVAVVEVLTGPLHAFQITPERQTRLPRAIPIGTTAIFDPGANGTLCAAATCGCRLKDLKTGGIFALSNNHVWADENNAPIGNPAVAPSPLDDNCFTGLASDIIGTLAAFVPIDFSSSGTNQVDTAIIRTSAQFVNTSTLVDGYGVPKSALVAAFLGQTVQKYGRTSGYTQGIVTGLNVLATVGYQAGAANFTNQIEVSGTNGFVSLGMPGDSGSLVVDMNRNPVGLLFAGGGGITLVNHIERVLPALNAELDKQTGTKGTKLVIDDSPATTIGKEGRGIPDSP
ncbi:MAG TPA: hypothetical protein VKU82_08070 [Planctomycetaceae bacterium]|nr:hypothetical protein [Planctomycetaceae bacterium]